MERIKIDLLPSGVMPNVYASQYDIGRRMRFVLTYGGESYVLTGAEDISVILRKPDKTEQTISLSNTSSNYVDWITSDDEINLAGFYLAEIRIEEGSSVIGSANFLLKAEEDPLDGRIEVRSASGIIATFNTALSEPLVALKANFMASQDLHGYDHPWAGGAGKNKFDFEGWLTECGIPYTKTNNKYDFTLSQTLYSRIYDFSDSDIQITLSAKILNGTSTNVRFDLLNQNNTVVGNLYEGSASTIVTASKLRLNWSTAGTVSIEKPQIELGSTATTYEPYSNICPLVPFTELNVTRTGVNVWDGAKTDNVGINASTGNLYASAGTFTTDYIKVNPSSSYYANPTNWKTWVCFFDVNKNYVGYANVSNGIFSTLATAYYMRISGDMNEVATASLNYPATDTSYHAYTFDTITLDLDGTRYGGYVDANNGKLVVTWGSVDLGTLTWVKIGMGGGRYGFRAGISDMALTPAANEEINAICECYSIDTGNNVYLGNVGLAGWGVSTHDIAVYDDTLESGDATAFKTAMSGMELAYELATPIEVDITPAFLSAIQGQNNVFHDGNGTIELSYLDKR